MKFPKALALAGLALALGVAPTWAADWGGIKDMGGGVAVPVPAPAPVPTFDADSDWYVGLMLGGNISQDADITSSGTGSSAIDARDSSDIGMSPIFGLMFGRYITPSLRAEIAIDYTPDSTIAGPSDSFYQTSKSETTISGDPPTAITSTSSYDVTRTDRVKLSRTTTLVNLLYDIPTGTRFTPYIGGGFGFSWRKMRRTYNETANCTGTVVGGVAGGCLDTTALPSTYKASGTVAKDQIDFAAAVQAGVAYNITDSIIWDNGWQMLWEGSAISLTAPTVDGESRVSYGDAVIQQFRSGIRIKFD